MAYIPHSAYGPWLRYQNWLQGNESLQDVATNAWTGSILVVSLGSQPPSLTVRHAGQQFTPQPTHLDAFQNFVFWRWQLDLQLLQQGSVVEYSITAEWDPAQPSEKRHSFTLPGQTQSWHWGFHSCNGFSHGVEESWLQAATALWQDVLQVHAQMPLHCMVGGGDQLYQDGFFKEPALVQWLQINDRSLREKAPVTSDMDAQMSHFMFHHYCNWFSKEHMAQAFACIPQVMTWDDHDLMDGYGSYPDALQNCPVFQHAFRVARRFYLLFQQHTALPQAQQQANLFGVGETYSLVRLLGHGVALVAPDVRSERTRKQVLSPASWQLIFDRIAALPATVKHLVMVTTIPVIYPKIPLSEKAMGLLSNIGREHAVDMLLSKTGLWGAVKGKVVSGFNEPELLDDLLDHWTSDFHAKEREMLIRRLQDVAKTRNIRVAFISGDVHVGGLGRLYSHPKMDLRKDFRFMPQVISSAIMNAPPPAGVVSTLHTCSNAHMSGVDKYTKEKMVRLFKADYPKSDKLIAKRNWATLWELPAGVRPPAISAGPKDVPLEPGDLLVTLRVEADHKQPHQPVKQYPIPIPTLQPLAGQYGVPAYGGTSSGYAGISSGAGSYPSTGTYGHQGVPSHPSYAPQQAYAAQASAPLSSSYTGAQYSNVPPATPAGAYGQTHVPQQQQLGFGPPSSVPQHGAGFYGGQQAQNTYAPCNVQAPGYEQQQQLQGAYSSYPPVQQGDLSQQFNGLCMSGTSSQSPGHYYPPSSQHQGHP